MRPLVLRVLVVVCSCAVIAQVLALWWHTGRAGLTRFYDPERAAFERGVAANDALLDDPSSAPTQPLGPPNTFALGLLPFGFGWHAISVSTIVIPALIAAGAALVPGRIRRTASPADKV